MKRFGLWFLMVASLMGAGLAQAAPLAISGATATHEEAVNPVTESFDGNLASSSRWSGMGDGVTATYQLQPGNTLQQVNIAWYDGHLRIFEFDLETSVDGAVWEPAFSGFSSGTTSQFEPYDISDRPALYVRIVGHGNDHADPNRSQWTSVLEVVFDGIPTPPETGEVVEVPLNVLQELCNSLPLPPAPPQ
jgi:hypothetical protein